MGTSKAQQIMEVHKVMASLISTSIDCNMQSFTDEAKVSLNNLFNQRQQYCRAYFDTNDEDIRRNAMDYFIRINGMICKALGIIVDNSAVIGGPIHVEFNIPGMQKELVSGLPNIEVKAPSMYKGSCGNTMCAWNVFGVCHLEGATTDCPTYRK